MGSSALMLQAPHHASLQNCLATGRESLRFFRNRAQLSMNDFHFPEPPPLKCPSRNNSHFLSMDSNNRLPLGVIFTHTTLRLSSRGRCRLTRPFVIRRFTQRVVAGRVENIFSAMSDIFKRGASFSSAKTSPSKSIIPARRKI